MDIAINERQNIDYNDKNVKIMFVTERTSR